MRDGQLRFGLVGDARRNESADRPKDDRIDLSADANGGERVGRFMQDNARERDGQGQQTVAEQVSCRERRKNDGQRGEDDEEDVDAGPGIPAHRPKLMLQRWTLHPSMTSLARLNSRVK